MTGSHRPRAMARGQDSELGGRMLVRRWTCKQTDSTDVTLTLPHAQTGWPGEGEGKVGSHTSHIQTLWAVSSHTGTTGQVQGPEHLCVVQQAAQQAQAKRPQKR